MKLVYAHEMGVLDKKAAEEFYLPTAVLMENAGRAVAESAAELLDGDVYAKSVVVFAGKGNNGGDGLVAARWLSSGGARVKIFLASPAAEFYRRGRRTAENLRQKRPCRYGAERRM